eukprot:TRINITY_DN11024_c0_g1_i1.p2 TRINITY_DN11024_c0_g1~~TRINITY_DN11024_c0_g1_i1.p2  ORF type:complete len:401 (+),score=173.99 TRINITY_DN11024_c0_g1_i1:82-1203(+)
MPAAAGATSPLTAMQQQQQQQHGGASAVGAGASASPAGLVGSGGAAGQASFTVRCFCTICGPAGQFYLKLGNATTLEDCRRSLWNQYAEFLRTQADHYPPLSPSVQDYDVVLALPDGRQDEGAPPLRGGEPLKLQLPRPCFLTLVIGQAWLERDAALRRETARRDALTVEQERELTVVHRVGVMHRIRQTELQDARREVEQRNAEFEQRAVAAMLRELEQRETEQRQRDELRARQGAHAERLAGLERSVEEYDAQKRALLAMSAVLLPTERLVEYTREAAGRRAARLREEAEAARRQLAARPQLRPPPATQRDAGHWSKSDLHQEAEGRRARRAAVTAQLARLRQRGAAAGESAPPQPSDRKRLAAMLAEQST